MTTDMQAKFSNVSCSQCGRDFGPGNSGFSDCRSHAFHEWLYRDGCLLDHTDDIAVDSFARAMKSKMAEARAKGRSGWEGCDPADLSRMLRQHIEKGDPRDVANFCMMLWHHSAPIAPPVAQPLTDEQRSVIQHAADMAHRVLCAGGDYGDELSDPGLRSDLKAAATSLRALLSKGGE